MLYTKYIQNTVYSTLLYLGLFQSPGRQKKTARQAKSTDLGYAASQCLLLKAYYNNTVETVSILIFRSLIYKLELL